MATARLTRSQYEGAFDKLLSSLKLEDEKSLRLSLDNAKAAAKGVGIYSREEGSGSYHTVKAALDLAVIVWKKEEQREKNKKKAVLDLAEAVWEAEKRHR